MSAVSYTIPQTVRDWSNLKIDDTALQARLGCKVKFVYDYRQLQDQLLRAKLDIDKTVDAKVKSSFEYVCMEPTLKSLETARDQLIEKMKDPSQQTPENYLALENIVNGISEFTSIFTKMAVGFKTSMLPTLQPIKDEIEALGLLQIKEEVPVQKSFYQGWIAPVTGYIPNPFAKRTKMPSKEKKQTTELKVEIEKVKTESAATESLLQGKHAKLIGEVVNEDLQKAVKMVDVAPISAPVIQSAEPPKIIRGKWEPVNLESFKIKPGDEKTSKTVILFEGVVNGFSEVTEMIVSRWIREAYCAGMQMLDDIATLQEKYPELKGQTPAQIFQNKDCYLSYFLQKAKNNLSCWPIEQDYMGLSDEIIALSKTLDEEVTQKAQQLGITLTPNYSLESMKWNEDAVVSGKSFEDD